MSTLTRSAKPGSSWTTFDLKSFNIQIDFQDFRAFFGISKLPVPDVSPIFWNNAKEPQDGPISKLEMDFFGYLMQVVYTHPDEETTARDFVVFLLKTLGFDAGRRLVLTRKEVPLFMCGEWVSAKVDIAMIECSGRPKRWVLLVQEDKHYLKENGPEPQLIAAAIGAFSENNLRREQAGLQSLSSQTILGIVIVGVALVFYKITITQEFLSSIASGEYPPQPTVVQRLKIPVNDVFRYLSRGMLELEYRRVALECLEAFKKLMNEQMNSGTT